MPPRERDIADAIGSLCEGHALSSDQVLLAQAALRGQVLTDRGPRRYYADLDTLMLQHVDTDECIWSVPEDGILRGGQQEALADLNQLVSARAQGFFPLQDLADPARMQAWEQAMARGSNLERQRWARLHKRLLRPLQRALKRFEQHMDSDSSPSLD